MKPDAKKLAAIAGNAGKATAALFEKAKKTVVETVDQNDDGTLTLDDVTSVIKQTQSFARENRDRWNEKREKTQRELELKTLCPIFAEDLDSADFRMTKLIRITGAIVRSSAQSSAAVKKSRLRETRICTPFPFPFRERAPVFGRYLYIPGERTSMRSGKPAAQSGSFFPLWLIGRRPRRDCSAPPAWNG